MLKIKKFQVVYHFDGITIIDNVYSRDLEDPNTPGKYNCVDSMFKWMCLDSFGDLKNETVIKIKWDFSKTNNEDIPVIGRENEVDFDGTYLSLFTKEGFFAQILFGQSNDILMWEIDYCKKSLEYFEFKFIDEYFCKIPIFHDQTLMYSSTLKNNFMMINYLLSDILTHDVRGEILWFMIEMFRLDISLYRLINP